MRSMMFFNLLKMDLKRSLDLRRFIPVVILFVFFIIIGRQEITSNLWAYLWPGSGFVDDFGSLEHIEWILAFDTYKVIWVLLLCSLYSNSFCREKSNGYLRMVMGRTDLTSYTQSKFIANTLGMIITSICSFAVFVLMLLPHASMMPENSENYHYYFDIMAAHPVVYLFMMGIQFGMAAAAFGSMGLLFSAFQPDGFVSIGLPGLLFFIAVSFSVHAGPFNVYAIVAMDQTLSLYMGNGDAVWLDYAWGIILPFLVICLCGYLFYLRVKRRMRDGDI